jgi:hypothetical protein
MADQQSPSTEESRTFAEQAAQPSPGLLREFWDFLRHNKKWWLAPIIIILLILGLLIALTAHSALSPFLYPL